MTVSLISVLTVIAVIWWIVLPICAIGGDEVACIIGIVVSLASAGLLLYRLGEFITFIARSVT